MSARRRRRSGARPDGKVDGFVSAVGTGGTLAGVAIGLKAKNPDVKIALADPLGAALYSYYTDGRAEGRGQLDHRRHRPGPHHRQSRRLHARLLLAGHRTRRRCRSSSTSSQEEGLCLGGSTGINIAGAIRLARELGPGHTHRDDPLRLRHALPVEAVQSGIPALEGPAGAGLDGARARDRRALRAGGLMAETEALFRDDAYLARPRRRVVAHQRARRHRARPHDLLCDVRRPAGRYRLDRTRGRHAASRSPARSPARARRRSSTFRPPGQPLPEVGEDVAPRASTGSAATG